MNEQRTTRTQVTVATDLFALGEGERAVVFFTARRHGAGPAPTMLLDELETLRAEGWLLSIDAMFTGSDEMSLYDAGFAHDVDVVGAFEAPGLSQAHAGIARLEQAGWARTFRTAWLVGRREFAPVPSTAGRDPSSPWAFFALWQWNDAWQQATPAERLHYDQECDVAFSSDVGSGISIAGRHRLDPGSRWHHLGMWELPALALLDDAMATHERVADFKFTTSLHYIGRRRPMTDVPGSRLVNTTVWIHYARPRSAWYELPEQTQAELQRTWAALDSHAQSAGAQSMGSFFVRGQSDYSTVEIWSFAGYEAAYEHWAAKVAAGYAEWFEFSNNVGNRLP